MKPDTYGPAFPTIRQGSVVTHFETTAGFTKRDYIAKDLLAALITNFNQANKVNDVFIADPERIKLVDQALEMTDLLLDRLKR